MAYAQQPRYGATSRPPHQNHQLPYGYSGEPYATKNGYGTRSQAVEFNGSTRHRPPLEYQESREPPSGTYGYSEDWPDQDHFYDGGNGRYEGRGQNRGRKRLPPHQLQERPIEAGRHLRHDPRSRGPPPGRGRYRQQDLYYQSNQYREPQGYKQHYQSEEMYHNGSQEHGNGDYEYDEFSSETPRTWTPTQHYNHPPHSDDRAYVDPEYNVGYPQQDRGGPSDSRVLEASAHRFNRDQPNSTRPQNLQQLKPCESAKARQKATSFISKRQLTVDSATDRTYEAPMSPDTVAWDNPFPTFPMRPSRAEHANASGGSMNLRDESQQDTIYDHRPQTASSKGSYAVSPGGKEKLNGNDLQHPSKTPPVAMLEASPNSKGGGYFEPRPQPERDAAQYRETAQDRPRIRDNGRRGARIDQIKPITNGRHSEDNRTRPSLPMTSGMDGGYERSRTLPTALSEAALVPGRPPGPLTWQEPGSVAGYHGPADRGYTPTSPVDRSQQRSFPQSPAYLDENRPAQVDAVVHAQSTDFRQPHSQKDSLGEFFDTYYDAPQDDHQPYLPGKDRHRRLPADEDMPNFDREPASSDDRRRGLTIEEHLQPQPRSQGMSPGSVPPREDVRGDRRHGPSSDPRHPRSRSQPNLKDRRSPKPPLDDGFDFGVPGSPNGPPATAPARNEYGASPNTNMTSSRRRLCQYQPDHESQGSLPPNGPKDYNRTHFPVPVPGQPSWAYQSNGISDRYRSPPAQNRRMGPPDGKTSPINHQANPTPDPATSTSNPDALPSHPMPVRPGLMQSFPLNQSPKPIPLRQYDSTPSSMQPSSPSKISGSSHTIDPKKQSVPVTHQELERLKQATMRNPEDQKSQLILAKKMVEAASVLVDERTDPRTRNKSREKYILDAHKIVKKLSNNGYSEATFYLADAYSRASLGLESDTREAFKLYQSAAKEGHAQAAYRVAVCCEIGHEEGGGTSRDAVKAMQWYKRAATLGDTPAMYKMGIISLKGLLGQPKNPKDAVIWLKRAAERADEENPHALHELVSLPVRVNTAGTVEADTV